jgi:uncharacterized protein
MAVPVVALYGSLNAVLSIALAANVSLARVRHRVSRGTGGVDALDLAVRIHANNAEFVPLGLVMLLIAELSGGASLWLHVLGGSLLVSRILHVIGMPRPAPNFGRFVGSGGTWISIVATAVYTLVLRYGA